MTAVDTRGTADVPLATRATGLLATFNAAGVLDLADVHTAATVARITGETDETVALALALAVRALRLGSVCVDLTTVAGDVFEAAEEGLEVADLPWPEPAAWLDRCRASRALADGPDAPDGRPLRLVAGNLYLERYWRQEEAVRRQLVDRRVRAPARRGRRPADRRARPPVHRGGTGPGRGGPAAAGGRGLRPPVGHRAGRRAGHRQDDHGRQGARHARRPTRATAADRAGRTDRQGRRPVVGGAGRRPQPARRPRTWRGSPTSPRSPCTGCSAGCPAAAAGSATTRTTGCRTTSWWSTRCPWCR